MTTHHQIAAIPVCPPDGAGRAANDGDGLKPYLAPRLRPVLKYLLSAKRTGEIAVLLGKSVTTIRDYRRQLILIFGVNTIEQVIAIAARTGWLKLLEEDEQRAATDEAGPASTSGHPFVTRSGDHKRR